MTHSKNQSVLNHYFRLRLFGLVYLSYNFLGKLLFSSLIGRHIGSVKIQMEYN